jgi:hypothetical protein
MPKKKEIDLTGGILNEVPNEYYKKFFDKFEEIKILEIEKWKPVHIFVMIYGNKNMYNL